MATFHLDLETSSSVPIKYGAARYASDPSTRILLCAVAKDDGPVHLWDTHRQDDECLKAIGLLHEISDDPDALVYAHNAPFELMVLHYLWESTFGFRKPAPEKYRCTQAMCRIARIPQSLEKAAEFLKLDIRKDSIGNLLIKKFSIPQKSKAGPYMIGPDYPKPFTLNKVKTLAADAWEKFREYCRADVEVERQIYKRLKPLEPKGWVLDAFKLDARLNLRGVPVDLEAVDKALAIIDDVTTRTTAEFVDLTGFAPGQNTMVKRWLQARGYPGDNLQVATVNAVLGAQESEDEVDEDEESEEPAVEVGELDTSKMQPEAWTALRLYSKIGYSALKKLPAMKNSVCPDGRLRGMFLWSGAGTGRYTSKIVQLQNLKRPSKTSESVFRLIRSGCADADTIDLLYGSPLDHISSAIRHFIGYPDRPIIGADYSQIEARVLPWLAGHEESLRMFREGKDAYSIAAASALGVDYETAEAKHRQMGKVIVLACGYAGGLQAMDAACVIYRVEMTTKEKRKTVKDWRKANAPIVKLWRELGDAAVEAVLKPGKWVKANDKARFACSSQLGYPCLVMEIPSGRKLYYPYPEATESFKIKRLLPGVTPDMVPQLEAEGMETHEWKPIPRYQAMGADGVLFKGVWATWDLSYFGSIKGSSKWGRLRLHSGILTENCLSADTQVLTEVGWKFIKEVADHKVFDGIEFVSHQGLTAFKKESTIRLGGPKGLGITPDHKVWSEEGPVSAANISTEKAHGYCNRLLKSACRSPYGYREEQPSKQRGQDTLGRKMRLWRGPEDGFDRPEQNKVLFQAMRPVSGPNTTKSHNTWNESSSRLRRMEEHGRPMQAPLPSSLEELRGSGNNGVHAVAGEFRKLLGGHGTYLQEGALFGQNEQRKGVFPRQLSLGHLPGKCIQQEEHSPHGHSLGGNVCSGSSSEIRDWSHDPAIPDTAEMEQRPDVFGTGCPEPCGKEVDRYAKRTNDEDRSSQGVGADFRMSEKQDCIGGPSGTSVRPYGGVQEEGSPEEVYDLINCGPRHRYVVRGPDKKAYLVSNCTQAVGADFLTLGALEAERRGFQQILTVHDEIASEYEPEKGQTAQKLVDAMCVLPSWAQDFPLAAVGDVVPFYTK